MKKGAWFGAVLVIIIVMSVVILISQLLTKVSVTRYIGDSQGPLLGVNADAKLFETFVRQAAIISIDRIISDVASNPDLQGLSGTGCVMLNTEKTPTQVAFAPHIDRGITIAFNNNMNPLMKQYADKSGWQIPQNNFEVYAEKGKLTAVSIKPVRFQVKDYTGQVIGNASFRPGVTIGYDHKFEKYPATFLQLEKIANSCSYSADPKKCAEDLKLTNWVIEDAGSNKFKFTANFGKVSSCYLLSLPT
jgi:hypothetical protein